MSHNLVRPQLLDFAILFALAVIWGSAFGAIKIAVADTGPFTLVGVRTALGASALFIVLGLTGGLRINVSQLSWRRLTAIALIGTALPFFLISWAEQYVDSAIAGLLNGAGPLVTALGGHFITRDELLTRARLMGILIGLCGMLILLQDGLVQIGSSSVHGQLALIFAFGCYAAGNLMVRGRTGLGPVQLACSSLLISSLVTVPAAFLLESPAPFSWPLPVWGALLWLSLVSTALGFSLRYLLISRAGAGFTANVGYLIPVVAVAIGYFGLGERVTVSTVFAMLIILLSLYITRQAGIKLRNRND